MSTSRYPQAIAPVDRVGPVPRRIRAMLAGRNVIDTTHALYLWEWPYEPQYLIPAADVDPQALIDTHKTSQSKRGTVTKLDLLVAGIERPDAGDRFNKSPIETLVWM